MTTTVFPNSPVIVKSQVIQSVQDGKVWSVSAREDQLADDAELSFTFITPAAPTQTFLLEGVAHGIGTIDVSFREAVTVDVVGSEDGGRFGHVWFNNKTSSARCFAWFCIFFYS